MAGSDPYGGQRGGGQRGGGERGRLPAPRPEDRYDDGYDDEYPEYDEDGRPILYDDGGPGVSRRPLILGAVALVLVAIIVVIVVASGDDEEPEATFSLAAAAANAEAAERVAYELSVRVDGRVVTAATGVIEPETGSQQVIDTTSSRDVNSVGPAGYVYDAGARAIYLDARSFEATGLTFERTFVRIDLDELGDGVTLDLDALVARYGGDPLAVVPLLGRTAAQDLGTETIDEEQVQQFRVEVTLDELLEANPDLRTLLRLGDAGDGSGDDREGTESSATDAAPTTTARPTSGSGGTADTDATVDGAPDPTDADAVGGSRRETVVIDVYVTEDNVIRRLEFATSVSGAAIGTVTFGAYDGDAQIELPASDQVIALADAF